MTRPLLLTSIPLLDECEDSKDAAPRELREYNDHLLMHPYMTHLRISVEAFRGSYSWQLQSALPFIYVAPGLRMPVAENPGVKWCVCFDLEYPHKCTATVSVPLPTPKDRQEMRWYSPWRSSATLWCPST